MIHIYIYILYTGSSCSSSWSCDDDHVPWRTLLPRYEGRPAHENDGGRHPDRHWSRQRANGCWLLTRQSRAQMASVNGPARQPAEEQRGPYWQCNDSRASCPSCTKWRQVVWFIHDKMAVDAEKDVEAKEKQRKADRALVDSVASTNPKTAVVHKSHTVHRHQMDLQRAGLGPIVWEVWRPEARSTSDEKDRRNLKLFGKHL